MLSVGLRERSTKALSEGEGSTERTRSKVAGSPVLPYSRNNAPMVWCPGGNGREKAVVGTGRSCFGHLKRNCQNCWPCPLELHATEMTCSWCSCFEAVSEAARSAPPWMFMRAG